MSFKTVAWTLLAALACALILLLNYWASYQPLSTLVYSGITAALCGLANLVVPFRFLGVHRRIVGALGLVGGVVLTCAALAWPAATIRVTQPKTRLDEVMPEYQFVERHSTRVQARPEQVLEAARESTFGDLRSMATLMRIRGAFLRTPAHGTGDLQNKRILQGFSGSGSLLDSSDHEIVMLGASNVRTQSRPAVRTPKDFAGYRERGALKIAFNFAVQDEGGGWCTLSTETRVLAMDDATRRGMARYWRLIVPGSGLLRLQWLAGIKARAERMGRV